MTQPSSPPKQTVLRTAQEVANYFGVSLRTIQNWMDGGLREICTPANPGQRDGHFPLEEIIAWRNKKKNQAVGSTDDPEIQKVKRELQELELMEKRFNVQKKIGGTIELDEAIRLSAKQAAATKTRLQELKQRLESILPQELDDDLKFHYLADVEDLLQEIFEEIGTELMALAKEAEQKQNQILKS